MTRPKNEFSWEDNGDGWMERVRPQSVKNMSGIVILLRPVDDKVSLYLTFRPDLMEATGWKLGDRLRVLIGVDWRSIKIVPDPDGNLVYALNASNEEQAALGNHVQSKMVIRVPDETIEKVGPEKITVTLEKCEISDGVLIVRWGGSDGDA